MDDKSDKISIHYKSQENEYAQELIDKLLEISEAAKISFSFICDVDNMKLDISWADETKKSIIFKVIKTNK